jgi:lysophospholipase L1-like esterase
MPLRNLRQYGVRVLAYLLVAAFIFGGGLLCGHYAPQIKSRFKSALAANSGFDASRLARVAVIVDSIGKPYLSRVSADDIYNTHTHTHTNVIDLAGFAFLEDNNYSLNRLVEAKSYSEGVDRHAGSTAGGRLRFRTNSPTLDFNITLDRPIISPWSSAYGAAGTDVYKIVDGERIWLATVYDEDQIVQLNTDSEMTDIVVYLPTYAGIANMDIGFEKGSALAPPTAYTKEKPIVFYGSSITQGSSASRPGLNFPALVADYFNADFINLGFSGSARGEQSVTEDIARIDMSAFVMEYDHNADTPAELSATHYNFYKTIRDAHPDIPIIMLSRISGGYSTSAEETAERVGIIRETYERATTEGDTNIFFISGSELLLKNAEYYLSDGKHPNDLGMAAIAEAIINVLSKCGYSSSFKYR